MIGSFIKTMELFFYFIFFCLTKRNRGNKQCLFEPASEWHQGLTPYFIFMRSKSLHTNCYKNKISLRSSTPTAQLPKCMLVCENQINQNYSRIK